MDHQRDGRRHQHHGAKATAEPVDPRRITVESAAYDGGNRQRQRCGAVQDDVRQAGCERYLAVGVNRVPDPRALGVDVGSPGRNRDLDARDFTFRGERRPLGRRFHAAWLSLDGNAAADPELIGPADRRAVGIESLEHGGLRRTRTDGLERRDGGRGREGLPCSNGPQQVQIVCRVHAPRPLFRRGGFAAGDVHAVENGWPLEAHGKHRVGDHRGGFCVHVRGRAVVQTGRVRHDPPGIHMMGEGVAAASDHGSIQRHPTLPHPGCKVRQYTLRSRHDAARLP